MSGIEYELNFWKEFVNTPRFLEGWCTDVKTPELNDTVYRFIRTKLPAKVLDCGSGVCSILTGTVPKEDLTVCDLLGTEYLSIFNYAHYNVQCPQPIACEELPYRNEFDMVHISNALDHTANPIMAYDKMLEATKPGGYLIIQSFENEGLHENWQGLHQWNLALQGKNLKITSKRGKSWLKTGALVADRQYKEHVGRHWLIFIVQKPS